MQKASFATVKLGFHFKAKISFSLVPNRELSVIMTKSFLVEGEV